MFSLSPTHRLNVAAILLSNLHGVDGDFKVTILLNDDHMIVDGRVWTSHADDVGRTLTCDTVPHQVSIHNIGIRDDVALIVDSEHEGLYVWRCEVRLNTVVAYRVGSGMPHVRMNEIAVTRWEGSEITVSHYKAKFSIVPMAGNLFCEDVWFALTRLGELCCPRCGSLLDNVFVVENDRSAVVFATVRQGKPITFYLTAADTKRQQIDVRCTYMCPFASSLTASILFDEHFLAIAAPSLRPLSEIYDCSIEGQYLRQNDGETTRGVINYAPPGAFHIDWE